MMMKLVALGSELARGYWANPAEVMTLQMTPQAGGDLFIEASSIESLLLLGSLVSGTLLLGGRFLAKRFGHPDRPQKASSWTSIDEQEKQGLEGAFLQILAHGPEKRELDILEQLKDPPRSELFCETLLMLEQEGFIDSWDIPFTQIETARQMLSGRFYRLTEKGRRHLSLRAFR